MILIILQYKNEYDKKIILLHQLIISKDILFSIYTLVKIFEIRGLAETTNRELFEN